MNFFMAATVEKQSASSASPCLYLDAELRVPRHAEARAINERDGAEALHVEPELEKPFILRLDYRAPIRRSRGLLTILVREADVDRGLHGLEGRDVVELLAREPRAVL